MVDHEWAPPEVAELPALPAGLARPWRVAGGVAVELFCAVRFREHGDLDVEVLRADAAALAAALPGWELHDAVGGGELTRWQPTSTSTTPCRGWARRRCAGWRRPVATAHPGSPWLPRLWAGR